MFCNARLLFFFREIHVFPLSIIFIRAFNLHNFYVDGKAPTDDSSSYETEVDHYKSIVFNATTVDSFITWHKHVH